MLIEILRLIGRYTLISVKYILLTLISMCSVDGSGLLALYVAEPFKGRNVSDVGVPMYENYALAAVVWLLVFLFLSWLCLFLIKKTLSPNSNLPYWIGLIAIIPCSLVCLYALSF